MITILDNLENKLEKYDIPAEVWAEWKSSKVTQYIYRVIKEKQIELLDEILQNDVSVVAIRAKIDTLEEILTHTPENVDV